LGLTLANFIGDILITKNIYNIFKQPTKTNDEEQKKKIQQQAKFRQVALNLEKDTEAAYDFCFLDEILSKPPRIFHL